MRVLSINETADRLGVAPSTVRGLVAAGKFVAPVQLSERRIGFVEAEVDEWIAHRPRGPLAQPAHLAPVEALI